MKTLVAIALTVGALVVGGRSAFGGDNETQLADQRIVSVHLAVGWENLPVDHLTIWEEAYLSSSKGETTYRLGSFSGFLLALAKDYDALGPWWQSLDCTPVMADSGYVDIYLLLGSGEVRRHRFRGACRPHEAVQKVRRILCAFQVGGFTTPSGRPFEVSELACASPRKGSPAGLD